MVTFEDDDDPEYESDEKMEDADADGDDADGDNDDDNDDNDEEDDDQDDDQDEADSPSQSQHQDRPSDQSPSRQNGEQQNPRVLLTSPSPHASTGRSSFAPHSFFPSMRPEALTASVYDIVPTMAAPQSTSINCVSATPDMRWVFSGGSDGYIRMYNWVDTANGKVPLTVAQKHPFVDSVMKAGALTTYWENEESSVRTPPAQSADEAKDSSPVYSLAAQSQAIWLASGLESGGINLQTCRHQAGTRITTLKEHTSAVSVLKLSHDEQSLISGSWDKNILDWDLNMGRVKRSFPGSGGQISAIEMRPTSSLPIPHVTEEMQEDRSTLSSNNANKPTANGTLANGIHSRRGSKILENGIEDAAGSADGSLFGDNDTGSLFGDNDDTGNNGGGGGFGDDDDDEFSKAIANGLQEAEDDEAAVGNGLDQTEDNTTAQDQDQDVSMADVSQGGPVQPPDMDVDALPLAGEIVADGPSRPEPSEAPAPLDDAPTAGLPHSEEDPSATLSNGVDHSSTEDALPSSESTFLDAAIDGTIRIWDRRVSQPIARILPPRNTPPWCMGACWSPDGNSFYAGRRNGTVDEYSMHKGFRMAEPSRTFRFPTGSGAVSSVRSMPNGKHLICASYDILRLYDLREQENSRHSAVPFLIVPGHRTGVISALHIDPTCKFMISTAGNRGWEGSSTEVLLGYEIHCQQPGS